MAELQERSLGATFYSETFGEKVNTSILNSWQAPQGKEKIFNCNY
jgi:hypothetical protein